jgi:glycosyltransferase involved in cell wall biosynthesis
MHGVDFLSCLPPAGVPVLATLHLPASWYPHETFRIARPRTYLNGVSRSQDATFPPTPMLLPPIPNGVPVPMLQARHARRRFALTLGRICPEKGVHLALDAARCADVPLLVAGEVFPYPEHRRYFEEKVRPRLDRLRRFVGPVGFDRKRRLLNAARCVLIPSLAPETSSLVAREAIACGTPVVAFANGALAETVDHGLTGFLVADSRAMAEAIPLCDSLDSAFMRRLGHGRFSLERMTGAYLDRYADLCRSRRVEGAA